MSSKLSKQSKKALGKGKEKASGPVQVNNESSSSDGEGSEVDEESLGNLRAALGEDWLDDVAQQMLNGLYENKEEGDMKVRDRANADSDENEDEDNNSDDAKTSHRQNENEEEDKEGGMELDEVSSVDEDAVPRQRIIVDNKDALERIRDSIKLDPSFSWAETLSVTYPSTHNVDVSDDLGRELSFYKQALHSAEAARTLAASHGLPFTRPSDYFAEMVKSDVHMERIRQRLLDESAGIKKGEEKRREREGKKFGKQVQVEKMRERERNRKELDEKIKSLKRKRKGGALDGTQGDDFDVALEDAVTERPAKRARMPRVKREAKYGHGGRGSVGWRSKQNTRESTDRFVLDGRGRSRGGRGGRGGTRGFGRGAKRLGKSRRLANKNK